MQLVVGFLAPASVVAGCGRDARQLQRCPVKHPAAPVSATLVYVSGGPGVAAATAKQVKALGGDVVWSQTSTIPPGDEVRGPDSAHIDAAVFAVGAGNPDSELTRWEEAVESFQAFQGQPLGLFVVRSIVISQVKHLLSRSERWVIIRPGALVAEEQERSDGSSTTAQGSRLIATDDVRANGIISREMVGIALANVALGRVSVEPMVGKAVGVYDRDRVISLPKGVQDYFA